ncbi:uncharacterized protein Bfra_009117 [Botrytis fragariae]|uniref:Uncharacterized protein n=1 Tax=Botrytis fragariae TaxID=1964551 RepID=A0A8H6EH72_9HELO|nr:uncharacterized protein Bfra_009117 [Botrytis fragariae]KAF5872088.1 hypothetical protein Bfra_009117 [Botrytis fragariae]
MSLNNFSIGSSGRGYGKLDEYGQPQRQSYGGSQPRTYQHGSGRSTMEPPPLNLTERNTPSPYPTHNNPLPPISSFLRLAAQSSHHPTQTSSTTSLRSPANFNVPAARSHYGTTSQSQHYPTSESRSREASNSLSDTKRFQELGSEKYQLSAPIQRSTMKKRGNEGTDFMQHFPAGIPTSMPRSPLPSDRPERDISTLSSRQAKKEQSRRRHKAKEGSKSRSSRPIASMPHQQPLKAYSESLQHYLTSVESPQAFEGNSHPTEKMPADFDME